MLEEGYNFHPSHNDHISASWHWKQSMIGDLSIKIIQYSSYNDNNNIKNNNYKPWKWRYVITSSWMIEWNKMAEIEPNLYFEFLLNDNGINEELILSLWQKPILYLIFTIIFLSSCTALSKPCFTFLSLIINKINIKSPSFIITLLNIFKFFIIPLLLIFTILIIINPLYDIFINEKIIPSSYPFKKGWLLAIQYFYIITCLKFILICFIMYWFGNIYHPKQFKIKLFDYLQLKLFSFNNLSRIRYKTSYSCDIEMGIYHHHHHKSRNKNKNKNKNTQQWFMKIILKFQNLKLYILHNILLKYFNILLLIIFKWCLSYLFCIIIIIWTIWILRFNDLHELRIIIGCEFIISLIWLLYSSINSYCHFFIYPQIRKYGDKYYDSNAFQKGI